MTAVHPDSDAILHDSGLSVAAQPLSQFGWLRHGSTTRAYSKPDSPRLDDLLRIREHLGAQDSFLAFAQQKHTNNVAKVTPDIQRSANGTGYHQFAETDALVTMQQNVTLAIMTADCAPVFLVDPVKRSIGLAHAGWKGTFGRIAETTVNELIASGSRPSDLIAWVGPMAGSCCYEVSDDLIEKFVGEFSQWPSSMIHSGRKLDLVALNCLQLENAGLLPHNVHRSNLCTIHHSSHFYSYRADNGTHGRIISAMVMLPD